MKNQYFGEFISQGKLIHFNRKIRNKKYSRTETINILAIINKIVFKNVESTYLRSKEENETNGTFIFSFIASPFHSDFLKAYMREKFLNTNDGFSAIFDEGIKEYLKKPNQNTFWNAVKKEEIKNCINEIIKLKDRIVIQIDRLILKDLVSKETEDVIVFVSSFKKEFLYRLSKNVTGFICRQIENPRLIRELSNGYEVPILTTSRNMSKANYAIINGITHKLSLNPNQLLIDKSLELKSSYTFKLGDDPSYSSEELKFYASLVDLRDIERAVSHDWYAGLAIFKTEFLYITKGYTPIFSELVKLYVDIINAFGDRLVQIKLPDFNDLMKIEYEKEIYTELSYIRDFTRIFHTNISAILRATELTKKSVTVIVPKLRMGSEISQWRDLLGSYTNFENVIDKKINFGIMMETESAFQYFEDYRYVYTSIFGLDNLIEEAMDKDKYEEIDFEEFELQVLPDLVDAHQYFRRNGIRMKHFVAGNVLKNEKFLKKLIAKGFKHFVIPLSHIKKSGQVIYDKEERRGEYVGVHVAREMAKLDKN